MRSQVSTVFFSRLSSVGQFLVLVHGAQVTRLEELQHGHAVCVFFWKGRRQSYGRVAPATFDSQGLHAPSNDTQLLGHTTTMTTRRFLDQVIGCTPGIHAEE